MNIRLFHAAQVVGEATEELVGSGSTRERLQAAGRILLGIAPDDFATFPILQKEFDDIHSKLSKIANEGDGSYNATIAKMSGVAMKNLTRQILDFERSLRATE